MCLSFTFGPGVCGFEMWSFIHTHRPPAFTLSARFSAVEQWWPSTLVL